MKMFQYSENLKVIKDKKSNAYLILYFPPFYKGQKYYIGLNKKLYPITVEIPKIVQIKSSKDVDEILSFWRRKIFFRYIKMFFIIYFPYYVYQFLFCYFVWICLNFDFYSLRFRICGVLLAYFFFSNNFTQIGNGNEK